MKKKLTLNQTWTLCLRQWKWTIKQLDKDTEKDVETLKEEWLKQHKYENDNNVENDCFFCEYATVICPKETKCEDCPGQFVSKTFSCLRNRYHYYDKPHKFYKKLLELNEKRKREN